MMQQRNPWELMAAAIDTDGDAAISFDEYAIFFEAQDDGDLVWEVESSFGFEPEERASRAKSGPHEGTRAPDFTLALHDGSGKVTLSSFQGKKPVALIFGSYT